MRSKAKEVVEVAKEVVTKFATFTIEEEKGREIVIIHLPTFSLRTYKKLINKLKVQVPSYRDGVSLRFLWSGPESL